MAGVAQVGEATDKRLCGFGFSLDAWCMEEPQAEVRLFGVEKEGGVESCIEQLREGRDVDLIVTAQRHAN